MPSRKTPLITGQIYHVFNRSVDEKPIFANRHFAKRVIDTLSFYRFDQVPVRLSYFLFWSGERKNQLIKDSNKQSKRQVEIISYCLMPNHFHLLLRQEKEEGISKFLSQFQNSYTKYFNTREKRKGHIFSGQFKSVRIETDEQLLHVSRYIHLNPYTSFVVKNLNNLISYPWSSFPQYIGMNSGFCNTDVILLKFKEPKEYLRFVVDQADYQRKLESIKHLIVE